MSPFTSSLAYSKHFLYCRPHESKDFVSMTAVSPVTQGSVPCGSSNIYCSMNGSSKQGIITLGCTRVLKFLKCACSVSLFRFNWKMRMVTMVIQLSVVKVSCDRSLYPTKIRDRGLLVFRHFLCLISVWQIELNLNAGFECPLILH